MGAVEVRYRRLMLIADVNFMTLENEKPLLGLLYSGVNLETTVVFGTTKLAYSFEPLPGLALKPYAGARWWSVDAKARVTSARLILEDIEKDFSRAWPDPVFGVSLRYDITDRWFVRGVADVGGGVSRVTWQTYGATGYQFTDWFGLSAGYRLLGVDYNRDGFEFDVIMQGLLLGFEFRI